MLLPRQAHCLSCLCWLLFTCGPVNVIAIIIQLQFLFDHAPQRSTYGNPVYIMMPGKRTTGMHKGRSWCTQGGGQAAKWAARAP